MKLTDFDTLMFDCYGTLIDWESGLLAGIRPWLARERIAKGDDAVLEAFGRIESDCERETPAKPYPGILADTLVRLAARLGAHASAADAASFGSSVGDWPAFADSPEALAYLKRHYRLVILSNVDRASFARSRVRLGVEFEHVYTAEDIGSYKPDPRNFEHALAGLADAGVDRRRILHTAQSLFHDHVPAKRAGLATMWIDRRQGRPGAGATPPADAKPDWTVPSLAAMVALHRGHARGGDV